MPSLGDKVLKEKAKGRQAFTCQGQKIYEWDQTIDEINIYIQPPKYVLKKYEEETKKKLQPGQSLPKLEVKIETEHVTIGVSGEKPYISVYDILLYIYIGIFRKIW